MDVDSGGIDHQPTTPSAAVDAPPSPIGAASTMPAAASGTTNGDPLALAIGGNGHHATHEGLAHTSSAVDVASATTTTSGSIATTSGDAVTGSTTDPAATLGLSSAPTSNNVSAVYRFYDVEATLTLKRREESSLARCKLCRQDGRVERKSCVRFSKSVTSNLWRHLKDYHPAVYDKYAAEKKTIQMHKLVSGKKRGRKKKTVATDASEGASSGVTGDDEERFLVDATEEEPANVETAIDRRKKIRRGGEEHFFQDYGIAVVSNNDKRTVDVDKIREAAAMMCLYEMIPFELCSSPGFRNLLSECHVGLPFVDDPSLMGNVFGRQAILMEARKIVLEARDRVQVLLKGLDGAHLVLTEWCCNSLCWPDGQRFTCLFAVGLDQEFNIVRRCLSVVSCEAGVSASTNSRLLHSESMKQALQSYPTFKHTHNLVVFDPFKKTEYGAFCRANKLEILESITCLLRDTMLSTITETPFTHPFIVGNDIGAVDEISLGEFGRLFDQGYFGDPTHMQAEGRGSLQAEDAWRELHLSDEAPSRILCELPNILTGHTLRDLLLKVLHIVAHIKQSCATRAVLRRIMVEEFKMEIGSFQQLFERELGSMVISMHSIHDVLLIAIKMMPTLQRYFDVHKDGVSDFSKLVQLASLSIYEWERVGYLSTLLKPFADATQKLQAEKYVISSLIIPTIFTLLEKLRDLSPPGDSALDELPEDIVALKTLAYQKLSSSFGYLFVEPDEDWSFNQRLTFNWLWVATLLDPRTRAFVIKGPLSATLFWDLVKAETAAISGVNKADGSDPKIHDLPDPSIPLQELEQGARGAVVGPASKSSGDLWDDLQANLTSCAQEELLLSSSKSALEVTKSNNLIEVEISFFQEEGRISLRSNPLEWWHNMRLKYPFLAKMARFVLSIPANPQCEEVAGVLDSGLVQRLSVQVSSVELSEVVCASINLRLEKHLELESSPRQMWTTV